MTSQIIKIKVEGFLKTANLAGLGELPTLFYGIAKKHGVRVGDRVEIESDCGTDLFAVGSYIGCDQFGRKISGFALFEKRI